MSIRLINILWAVILIIGLNFPAARGDDLFISNYPCQDTPKVCLSSGIRTIDGEEVHRDCWEWSYSKTCNYVSKNDCNRDCYFVGLLECLAKDSLGNCVNQRKEFSCKRWVPVEVETSRVRTDLTEKEGAEIVCKGIPCIDGNCVDKSYLTDGDMMDSISKLYALSQAKGANDLNFKLFEGFSQHCSKKATGYTNCCAEGRASWGKHVGASCTKDENLLIENRRKNLCVYVGKEKKSTLGTTTLVKHHWCCFGNMLNKVIQVEGRKQLGLNFGTGGNPDCRGLTLDELMRLDFSQMDLSEFIEDFKGKFFGKYKSPIPRDMTKRVQDSIPNIKTYDNNPNNKENNKTGWSNKVADNMSEALEEKKRVEEENQRIAKEQAALLEQQRLAKEQAALLEQQRIAKQQAALIEQQRLAKERVALAEQSRAAAKKAKKVIMEDQLKQLIRERDELRRTNHSIYLELRKYFRSAEINQNSIIEESRQLRSAAPAVADKITKINYALRNKDYSIAYIEDNLRTGNY